MGDEHRVFNVKIYGFKAYDLVTRNGKPASQPVIHVLWDHHHKFHTSKGKGPNAQWTDSFEFEYETRRLNANVGKELRLDCVQSHLVKSSPVGTVRVPLIDILNGPQYFDLTLKEGGSLGGKLKFVATATQVCRTFMSLTQCNTTVPPQILQSFASKSKSKGGDVYALQYGLLHDVAISPDRSNAALFKQFRVTEGIEPSSTGEFEWSAVPQLKVEIDSLECYTGNSGLCLQLCAFPRKKKIIPGKGTLLFEGRVSLLSLLPTQDGQLMHQRPGSDSNSSGDIQVEGAIRAGVVFNMELLEWPSQMSTGVELTARLTADDFPTFSQLDAVSVPIPGDSNPMINPSGEKHRVRTDHGIHTMNGSQPRHLLHISTQNGGPRRASLQSQTQERMAPSSRLRSQTTHAHDAMTTVRESAPSETLSPNGMVYRFEVVFPLGGRLGLDLTDSPPGSKSPMAVNSVRPGHHAARSKKIQAGDTIVAINGIPLKGFIYEDALDMLKQACQGTVTLVCERTRFYQIQFVDQAMKLGLRLTSRVDEDLGAMVDSVVELSEASQHHRIAPGHLIMGVNGKWFTNENYETTRRILQNTSKPLSIFFQDASVLNVINQQERQHFLSEGAQIIEAVRVPTAPEENDAIIPSAPESLDFPPLPPKTKGNSFRSSSLEGVLPALPPKPNKEDSIDQDSVVNFVGVTGASEAQAIAFLNKHEGNLMNAINAFFDAPSLPVSSETSHLTPFEDEDSGDELIDQFDPEPTAPAPVVMTTAPLFCESTGAPLNESARQLCIEQAPPLFHEDSGEPLNGGARRLCVEQLDNPKVLAGATDTSASHALQGGSSGIANSPGTLPGTQPGLSSTGGAVPPSGALSTAQSALPSAAIGSRPPTLPSNGDNSSSTIAGQGTLAVASGMAALTLGSQTSSPGTAEESLPQEEEQRTFSMKVKSTGYGNAQVGKCGNCNKKFAMENGTKMIKCPHCGAINETDVKSPQV